MTQVSETAKEEATIITIDKADRIYGTLSSQVLEAGAKVEPTFKVEVVSMRGNMTADMTLEVADNIAQWG